MPMTPQNLVRRTLLRQSTLQREVQREERTVKTTVRKPSK